MDLFQVRVRMTDKPETRIHKRAVAEVRESLVRRGLWSGDHDKDAHPFFHATNEGKVSKRQAGERRALGLGAGVSDLVFVMPIRVGGVAAPDGTWAFPPLPFRDHSRGAALEIKAPRRKADRRQKQWLEFWAAAGFATAVTAGHRATAEQLLAWGYIEPWQRDRWIAWAETYDREAL
jgi:hypothetical protein